MISSRFFTRSSSPLVIFLLLFVSSPPPNTLHKCLASPAPAPASIEDILNFEKSTDALDSDESDPLPSEIGDLVQVAPSLALHQQEAAEKSIKSIKTPGGTVKCSCQTVSEEGDENDNDDPSSISKNFPSSDPTKTIEIEIYKPNGDDEFVESEDREDTVQERESHRFIKKRPAFVKTSFTLDGDEDAYSKSSDVADADAVTPLSENPRFSSSEEPNSFLSFLNTLVSSSALEQAHHQSQALSQSQSEPLRASEPDRIKTEAEQESVQVYNDDTNSDDDLASLKDDSHDVNVVNHRMFDMVSSTEPVVPLPTTTSNMKTVYKAYRTADLIGAHSFLPPSSTNGNGVSGVVDINNNEKMDQKLPDDFFLWDFIYADHHGSLSGKKREHLKLGTVTGPFMGPRRRRRRKRSLRGNGHNPPISFVYPVGYNPTQNATPNEKQQNGVVVPENKTKPEVTNQKMELRSEELDPDEVHRAMQAAMDRAWQQYGPKGLDAPPVTPAPLTQVYVIPAAEQPPIPPLPGQSAQSKSKQQQQQARIPVPHHPSQQQQMVYYTPPRPFLFIDRIFNPFQPMTSEWDEHVTTSIGPPPPPPEPGFFSRFLAAYIDFEVNNHEAADIMRKVVFGIFVGFLVAGWIALGAALGIIPFKKLIAWVAGTHLDGNAAGTKRNDKGKEFMIRDTTLSEITDKILLSLDADWLKRLEERVMNSEADGGTTASGTKIPTQVFCCILPDAHTNGMVECQVTKSLGHNSKKKTSAFKCISDLIYNFNFGPREDEEFEVEEDNIVNVKNKANNNNSNREEQEES